MIVRPASVFTKCACASMRYRGISVVCAGTTNATIRIMPTRAVNLDLRKIMPYAAKAPTPTWITTPKNVTTSVFHRERTIGTVANAFV